MNSHPQKTLRKRCRVRRLATDSLRELPVTMAALEAATYVATALVISRFYAALADGSYPHAALRSAQHWVAEAAAAELSQLSHARLRRAPEAAWLPYNLAIELSALTLHPDVRAGSAAVFGHPADWAALSCLEA